MVKITSWNVNGLRTRIIDNKDASQFRQKTQIDTDSNLGQLIEEFDPDILCFTETRCSLETAQKFQIPGYYKYYNSSSSLEKGRSGDRYSGVAVWSKLKPNYVSDLLPTLSENNLEGRILTLYFNNFILINTYQPNAGSNFEYRITQWDPAMGQYLEILKQECPHIPIIWTGDLNIARTPIDVHFGDIRHKKKNLTDPIKLETARLKYWESDLIKGIGDKAYPGFTREERENFNDILKLGFKDIWRHLNPNIEYDGYTWWNMRIPAYRPHNKGWRIDYFLIDDQHLNLVQQCRVFKHIGESTKSTIGKYGSDHAPIGLELSL